jgi:mRNA interferase RelE/StbE
MAERFYEVRVAQSADKDIQALPSEIRKRIEDAIQELASNPFPSGCKKLQGERNRFRVRVGKYRIIYSVTYRRLKPTACPYADERRASALKGACLPSAVGLPAAKLGRGLGDDDVGSPPTSPPPKPKGSDGIDCLPPAGKQPFLSRKGRVP